MTLFSKADMDKLVNDMEEEMRATFTEELEIFYRMSGVFVQVLMFDAERQKVNVNGDVHFMENYKALQDLKEFESLMLTDHSTLEKRPTAAVVKIEKVFVADEETAVKNKRLEAEVEQLRQKLQAVQSGIVKQALKNQTDNFEITYTSEDSQKDKDLADQLARANQRVKDVEG